MKTFLISIFILLISVSTCFSLSSNQIYLPDGKILDTSNLTQQDIDQAIAVAIKTMNFSSTQVVDVVKGGCFI